MKRCLKFLVFSFFRILGSPPTYDFSRKSFTPNLSKLCLFPSYADYSDYYEDEEEWALEFSEILLIACLERIFIFTGMVGIVLGSIISIWSNLDSEFRNLHKLAPNKNDYKMSSVPSEHVKTKNVKWQTLLTTNESSVCNNISNRHEGSIKSK